MRLNLLSAEFNSQQHDINNNSRLFDVDGWCFVDNKCET